MADDIAVVRTAIVDVVESDPGFRVVAAVSDGPSAIAAVTEHQPHFVVVDVAMPGNGRTVSQHVKAVRPAALVVAYTAYDDDSSRRRLLAAGADAYVVKGRDSLLDVLRALVEPGVRAPG